MNPTPASTPSGATPGPIPVKPLRGRTLALARGTWLVVAVLALGFFAAGIPSEFVMFHTVCQDACLGGQVTQAGSRALRDLGLSLDFYAAYAVVHDVVFAAVYVAVAVIIFWRKSDERMAMLASFALLTFGTAGLPNTTYALSIEYASLWWPLSLLDFLGAASFGLFLYHFPDGRFVPGWTRWVVFAWIAWQLPAYWFPSWDSFDLDGWPGWLAITVWTAFLGTMIYTQAYRYLRVSGATERQQIKWVVFGISVAALVYLGIVVALSPFAPAPATPGMVANVLIGYTFLYAAMLLVPLSIGFAILRHHLFDINLIINRTLVYGALTASVVALYVLVVGRVGAALAGEREPDRLPYRDRPDGGALPSAPHTPAAWGQPPDVRGARRAIRGALAPRPAPGGDPHPRRDATHRGADGGRSAEASLRRHRDRPRRPDGDDGDRQAGGGTRPVTAHLRWGDRRTDGPGTAGGRNLHAGGRRAARGSGAPDGQSPSTR